MPTLSYHPEVFIRPSPAGDTLGGVSDSTREAIALCEAAGYTNICIETVGVGQSEVSARDMCDFLLLLVLPGGGDDLQGIKRGIVEMSDAIAVTKSDGDQVKTALKTKLNYQQASHFFAVKEHGFKTQVISCSAHELAGIDALWTLMAEFYNSSKRSGYLDALREEQDIKWFRGKTQTLIRELIMNDVQIDKLYQGLETQIHAHHSPTK